MKKFYFLLLGLFLFTTANAQIINFPDANFKAKLLNASSSNTTAKDLIGNYFKIDANSDGEIEVNEALQVSYLNVYSSSISSLTGILNFNNLQDLNCRVNQLTSLDVSDLTNLTELRCHNNQLTTLDVSGLTNLVYLDCCDNQLPYLDVSGLTNLTFLLCTNNQLTSLDVNGFTNMTQLYCDKNQLFSLDVNGLTNLTDLVCPYNNLSFLDVSSLINLTNLWCSANQITSLDVSDLTNLDRLRCYDNQLTLINVTGLTNLTYFNCSDNQLPSLDVSDLTNLSSLFCHNNPLLETLFMKNGSNEISLAFSNNPNLQYICADDSQLVQIQDLINTYGYTNCHVNSYCSFVPGGEYYTIQGNNKFDNDNNGCDVSDMIFPNLKFSITDGTNSGSLIADTTGSYHYDVQAGTHTITPTLENPTYFNVSPTSTTVDFPTQASPFTQDFCVTANGVHPDLEVTLLPTTPARPGFEAIYKVIYKNKGTTTQSGLVNLTFDDAVLDLISSSPSTTIQTTNNLTWDFTNLLPFETREITLTLNVNAPTDTPAVNNGDILDYTTTITSPATDDTPNDNTSIFHQTVVGSYDPNDKTCLEGTTISPAMVGEYVHYVIRFENTGTFPAENIVVKDMIDLAKFDINTLVPIKGSHSFVTNITAGNKVEFIFENINLPFDDANNDGFVAFKIKTNSSLVLGDTFTNSANIYFDYNFPIVTDPATTTVQTLGKSDFEFAMYFALYPNPASTELNLSVKSGIEVVSINVYNTLGQLVIAIPNAQTVSNIDVSRLTSGNYFIKMNTDKGTSNTKFIKK